MLLPQFDIVDQVDCMVGRCLWVEIAGAKVKHTGRD